MPGAQDGPMATATFDTPTGLALTAHDEAPIRHSMVTHVIGGMLSVRTCVRVNKCTAMKHRDGAVLLQSTNVCTATLW